MTTTNWIELPKLVEYLYCSERTVYKLKKNGVFIAGEHFYRVGEGSVKGKCVYSLEQCKKALFDLSKRNKPKGVQYKKKIMKDLVAKEVK